MTHNNLPVSPGKPPMDTALEFIWQFSTTRSRILPTGDSTPVGIRNGLSHQSEPGWEIDEPGPFFSQEYSQEANRHDKLDHLVLLADNRERGFGS